MKTYWRTRNQAEFLANKIWEFNYAKKIKDIKSLLMIDPTEISKIDNPSEEQQLFAVRKSGNTIKFIFEKGISPSKNVQIEALKQNGESIRHFKNPSEELQIIAVSNSKFAITHIDNPSEKIQLASVEAEGNSILFIKNPTEPVQILAINKSPDFMRLIDNPTPKAMKLYEKLTGKKYKKYGE